MRRRLVLAIGGVAAVAVLLFAVPLGIVLGNSYRDRELLRLQRDTVAATRRIDIAPGRADPVELPRSHDALGVYDVSGDRIAGRGPAVADGTVRAALRTGRPVAETIGDALVAAAPLVVGERVAGAVRAQRADSAVESDVWRARVAVAALAGGLVLAAALAALVLGRRLAGPLERLAVAARRLGDGDFTVRAPRGSVPEVDAVAASLDATATRLGELVARERAFSADASHQLRTPLTALRVELEALELRDELAEVAAALREVERLEGTIATLLAVARDAPRGAATADLSAVLEELGRDWRPRLGRLARPLRIAVRVPDATVRASADVVREILGVLVDNALEHGGGAVDLTVRAAGRFVAVDVTDEGAGVGPEAGDVFARRGGGGPGHGIGLALARSLAHAEGGRLALARTGPRPTFTLTLAAASDGDRED